jgi:hypothetical protein
MAHRMPGVHDWRLETMELEIEDGPLLIDASEAATLDEGKPDLVVAFPGGGGTKDMVRRAVKAGVPIHRSSHFAVTHKTADFLSMMW